MYNWKKFIVFNFTFEGLLYYITYEMRNNKNIDSPPPVYNFMPTPKKKPLAQTHTIAIGQQSTELADSNGILIGPKRSYTVVGILFAINLLNYMDRFTIAGKLIWKQAKNTTVVCRTLCQFFSRSHRHSALFWHQRRHGWSLANVVHLFLHDLRTLVRLLGRPILTEDHHDCGYFRLDICSFDEHVCWPQCMFRILCYNTRYPMVFLAFLDFHVGSRNCGHWRSFLQHCFADHHCRSVC